MSVGSKTRRLRAALFAATLTVGLGAPVLLPSAPAEAAAVSGGSWDDNGPGSGSGGTDPGGSGAGANDFKCSGKYLIYKPTNTRAYENPYPNCDPAYNRVSWSRTGRIDLCPVGFQVFRFYGTYKNPAAAYTVSDLNLTKWCDNESLYSFWATNPSDSTGKAPGSPWFSLSKTANPEGKAYIGTARFSQWGRTEFGLLAPGVKYSASSSACTVAQTSPNPLSAYLNDTAVTEAAKKNAKQVFWNSYLTLSRNGKYPKTALAVLGLKSISNKNGTIKFTFDTRNCASPMNFVSTADTKKLSSSAEQAKFKVTGTCYIPVDRMRYEIKSATGSKRYGWPTLAGWRQMGLRYSDFYKNSAYTNAAPRGAQGGTPNSYEKATLKAWRNAMGAWFDKAPKYTGSGPSKDQYLPAAPYKKNAQGKPTGVTQDPDWRTARSYLVNQSRCRFGSQVSFNSTTSGSAPTAKVGLTMTNKQLFQSGGLTRIQEVRIAADPIKCTSSAQVCATANVKLAELHYNVAVAGTGGYTECKGAVTKGCDYKVLSITPRTTGKIQPTTVIQLAFFNPTMSAEKVKFTISGASAKYQYQANVGSIDLDIVDPISGAPLSLSSKGGTQPFTKAVSVGVKGSPVALSASGSAYTYQAPVIGAVDRVLD